MSESVSLEVKNALDSIRGSFDTLKESVSAVQRQADAIESKITERHGSGGVQTKGPADEIWESQEFKNFREIGGRGASVQFKIPDFARKSTVVASDFDYSAPGSFTSDRRPGIVGAQFRRLFARDLLSVVQTGGSHVDFIRVTAQGEASPQHETEVKQQSSLSFELVSEKLQTIAAWIPASRQALDDLPSLRRAIDSHLVYQVRLREEIEVLFGGGAGVNMNGIVTQATPFDDSLLGLGSWSYLDAIARAIQQCEQADFPCDGIILNTADFWSLALTKDSQGRFLFGDPSEATEPRLWGRRVAVSNNMTEGSFLVGAFQLAATLYERSDVLVELSTSHEDYFSRNLVAIRAEGRSCVAVMRPEAFVYGSLSTSP